MAKTWVQSVLGPRTGLDWTSAAVLGAIDPYIAWLELSDLEGKPLADDGKVPLSFEVDPARWPSFKSQASRRGWLQVPPAYRDRDAVRFCTARVALADLPRLAELGVLRVDLGLVSQFTSAPFFSALWRSAMRLLGGHGPVAANDFGPGQRPVLAVIDHGCAFAHLQFRRQAAGAPLRTSRVRGLWHQGSDLGVAPGEFGYGSEWSGRELDALLARHLGAQAGESAAGHLDCYKAVGYAQPTSAGWHGTHVMDMLTGRPDPLALPGESADEAGALDLLFVNVPERAIADMSGGWLSFHLLDAMRWILDHAPEDRPLVVNLSLGAQAGAHDGLSVLESAIDEMLAQERPRDTVVALAGGNFFDSDVHARLDLAAAGSAGATDTLEWDVSPADATDSCLEIWLPAGARARVTVKPPQAAPIGPVDGEGVWMLADSGQPAVAMLLRAARTSLGSGALVLLALAPTRAAMPGMQVAEGGRWTVQIENLASQPLAVEAWIERDDPAWSVGVAGRQSVFNRHVSPSGTLSSLAGGARTTVVAASVRSSGAPASFSSAGPTRGARRAPDVMAPGEARPDVGFDVTGVLPNSQRAQARGTSMAAPVLARAAANSLAAGPRGRTAAQILDALSGITPTPNSDRALRVYRR